MLLETGLIIVKKNNDFFIDPVYNESLTKRQLIYFLTHILGVAVEEIAMMFECFHSEPEKLEAHFGIFGTFLFAKRITK